MTGDRGGAHAASEPGPRHAGARRWLTTLAATAATTYALDLVATGTGLLAVASGLLDGIDHWPALFLLFVTYLAWGAGLWNILQVNWDMLQRTGTSINLLSKAGHDLVGRLTARPRWRRAAAHAGYVATELAKEAPYYVGSAGAALFSDTITAVDAIIFLAGANLGAAAYEFTLAHGMRFFVRRITNGSGAEQPRAISDLPRRHAEHTPLSAADGDRRGQV